MTPNETIAEHSILLKYSLPTQKLTNLWAIFSLRLEPCTFFPTAVSIAVGRGCLQAEELKLNCEIWSTYILMTPIRP